MKLRLVTLLLFLANIVFSQNFHDTQGKLEISSAGQATYTLPIAMPPSLQNVGPIINLTYASGQMGGIAGQGWNISSISSISRMATRINIEGYVDGVDFDDNDKLAFDGQRLVLKTGTYWADGSTYVTEVQSNTKIELKSTGTTMYFIVTATDGSRSWYGNYSGANASDLSAWYITRFEDTNGNYMTYHYTNLIANSLYISEIKFSANVAGLAPLNTIKFNYKQASRPEYAYIKGVSLQKTQILDYIEVKTNNQLFRKYQLTHTTDNLGYQRVTQLQEFNGSLEPANPVVFEYLNTPDGVNTQLYPPNMWFPHGYYDIPMKTYANNLNFDSIEFSGDFDGDGKLDFVANNALYTNLFDGNSGNLPITLPFSDINEKFFPATTLINNKLNQHQSIVLQKKSTPTSTEFKIYNKVGNNFVYAFSKFANSENAYSVEEHHDIIVESPCYQYPIYDCNYPALNDVSLCNEIRASNNASNPTTIEGDFNGDGISEVLLKSISGGTRVVLQTYSHEDGMGTVFYQTCSQNVIIGEDSFNYSIVDLNPNALIPESNINSNIFYDDLIPIQQKEFVSDFNGDGKSDLLIINPDNGNYKIISFTQNLTLLTVEAEILGEGVISSYTREKPILFGDYNGDGKIDFMTPVAIDSYNWTIYYANPKQIVASISTNFFDPVTISSIIYHPTQSGQTYQDWTDYYAIDINKDGKTDLVSVYRNYYKPGWTINDHNTSWSVQAFMNNLATSGTFSPYYDSGVRNSDSPEIPTVVTANYKNNGLNNDLVIVRGHSNAIEYYGFAKNVQTDNLLKKVTSSGGNIVDEISYQTMEPSTTLNNGQGALNEFYSSTNSVDYPNVEIKKLPTMNLVSQLKNTVGGIVRFQDFRYNGFTINLHGLGSFGFAKTARSVWYENATAPRIWSVTENNTSYLRGATGRSYTQLFSQGNAFSFVSPGTTPNGIINGTTNSYIYYTINNVYNIFLNTQVSQDYLTFASTQTGYTYDFLTLLPTTVVSKNMSAGFQSISTTTNTYDNNPTGIGSNYYIGRPKTSKTVTNAYANNSENSIEYYYANNRLTKTKKKGNTTDVKYLVEDFGYDSYGNITKKTISTEGYMGINLDPRSTEYTYDLSGRFIKTIKDVEGLITKNNTFHPLYGLVISSTNPFGLTTTSQLDNWGKPTIVKDYLGKSIYFSYTKSGTLYTETKTGDDGSTSIAISDALGRPIKVGSKNIDGNWSYKDINYDFLGRKYRTSEPYATGSPTLWNTTTYDVYNRPITITPATGLTTNIAYSGLTVTAADNFKTTTTTKNANGNVISSSDNGGVINYTYYANGNLKTSNFEGTIISTEYDEWGRKTKLTDPSAGTYTYSYYPTGEVHTETTPKGTTTYTLDPATGKLMTKTILGENTDSTVTYNYDATSKLPVSTLFFDAILGDGATYEYYYDGEQRIISTVEKTTPVTFIRENTYDAFGRLDTETYIATNNTNGLESNKTIKNTYKNGSHWQILDNNTSERLWETSSVNARGQLTSGFYGNNVVLSNTYDQYGFTTQSSNQKFNATTGVTDNIITLGYSFEPLRGNLNSRTNSAFAWNETFTYDTLDRLSTYTNAQGILETQAYDNKGRIATSSIGAYNYTNTAKKYQNTSVTLTPEAEVYYQAEEQQNISYNVFKSPVRIQSNQDIIDFTYNMLNNRSVMYYGSLEKDVTLRRMRKYYDATGTMEIKYDTKNDTTEFITYIGGDAYSAPIVLKSEGNEKEEFLYLHRDYQGSILAITNKSGQVVEKRLFDAWGSIVKVVGIGGDLPGLTVLDRGYTGHEHLQSVGLIHMNGRLYDPKLHRFLQPDNYVQDPYNTQNYNRYGYVLNNPLKYTDPSGEYGLGAAVIIGAAIAAITYTLTALTTDTPFSVGGLITASFIGAVSATVTFGIGTAVSTIGNVYLEAAMGALLHGTFQGGMAGLQGGNFWQSFAAGAIASIAASSFSFDGNVGDKTSLGWADSVRSSTGGMIAFGTIMGGAGASLTGGNFWQGAVTGLVVSGLNHAMHSRDSYEDVDQEDPEQKVHPKPDASKLDKRFNTGGKDWEKKGGRWTITTKKEILQWDSQHGEVEVYSKGQKTHMGGANPYDRDVMTKAKSGRIPNGGWKVTTSKVLGLMNKLNNFLSLPAFMSLPPLFQMQMQSLPGYVNPNPTIQTY